MPTPTSSTLPSAAHQDGKQRDEGTDEERDERANVKKQVCQGAKKQQ
jgi:hypothetical protein